MWENMLIGKWPLSFVEGPVFIERPPRPGLYTGWGLLIRSYVMTSHDLCFRLQDQGLVSIFASLVGSGFAFAKKAR